VVKGQVFLADNNFKRIFLQNVEAIIIALFSIYGTRLLPFVFLPFIKSLRIEFNFLFFYIPMLIFTFLGLNTTQFPGSFNTFNFFIVNCFVLIYFLPAVIFWFKNKIKIKFLFNTLLIIIVALTVPRALYQTYRFCKMILEDKKSLLITNEQIELFTYLKKNKDNWLIQPYPNNITASSNSFLPFFSQRASYLTGQQTLDSQGFNWQNRSQELENIFNLSDYRLRSELFKKLSIYYFYIQNDDEIKWLDLENTTNNWYDIIASNNAGYLIKLK